ncbi:MAG: hypothetical protein ACHQUC_00030 [Chlamydiales bacterium]
MMALFTSPVIYKRIQFLVAHSTLLLQQLRLIALWGLISFVQIALFCLPLENFYALDIFDLLGILFFSILFVEFAFIFTNFSAFVFWVFAKRLKGSGSFSETSLSLLKVFLQTTTPLGFFYFIPNLEGPLGSILLSISAIGTLGSLVYGFVVMITSFSKIHRFSENRAFLTFIFGILVLSPLAFFMHMMIMLQGGFYNSIRAIYIATVPMSIQILVTVGLIFIGSKMSKKFVRPSN